VDDFEGRVLEMLTDIRERLTAVETIHVERCETRAQRLEVVEAEVVRHRGEIQRLREHRSFSRGQQAALVAIGSMLAGILGGVAGQVVPHFFGG